MIDQKKKKRLHLDCVNPDQWEKLSHASLTSRTLPRLNKQDTGELTALAKVGKSLKFLIHRKVTGIVWIWQLKADATLCGIQRVNAVLCDHWRPGATLPSLRLLSRSLG